MGKKFNIGILAHVDAGKTTITEQLLGVSGAVRHTGSVDDGTATTDWLEVERSRGISVSTACAVLHYGDDDICLVDTPGHVDFAGEVERSLSVLDGAVLVVTAVEGVQSYTEILWRALEKLSIPAIIVINKIDRAGSNVRGVMESLDRLTGGRSVLMQGVSGEGDASCTVTGPDNGGWEDILLHLAEHDAKIEEMLFSGESVWDETVSDALREQCARREVIPVVCTSAKLGTGIKELLDSVVLYLPDSSRIECKELSGVIFRVIHDASMGKTAFVRLFGGRLSSRDALTVPGGEKQNKITQIRRYSGRKFEDIGSFGAGEIAAVCGLADFKNGDIIGTVPPERVCSIAETMLMVQAIPSSEEERPILLEALRELSEEEPLLALDYNARTREIYIRITGLIQLEVLGETLESAYGLETQFSDAAVIYKETPVSKAKGFWAYTMPKPCWAIVELSMEPLPRGSGIVFESAIKEGTLVRRYQHHVETSVYRTASQGIYGWEVTDAKVILTDGNSHPVHTHPLDFFTATPVAFLRALTNCSSQLLEPYVKVTMSAREDLLGKVLGHIIDMRGEFDTPVIANGIFSLDAVLPVSESVDYPLKFRSLTSGKGLYSSRFYEYRPCPPGIEAVLPRRGVDPLDIPQWILSCRGAMA